MYLDLDFFTKGEQENPLLRKEVHKAYYDKPIASTKSSMHKAYYDKPIASTKSSMLKPNKSRVISHKKMCHNLHDNQIFDHSKIESEQKNRAYVRVWPTNPYRRSCRREKPAREKAKEMNFDKIITLTGNDKGNELNKLGDINFWINSKAYNLIENAHQALLLSLVDLN